jgi:hypothetical protein
LHESSLEKIIYIKTIAHFFPFLLILSVKTDGRATLAFFGFKNIRFFAFFVNLNNTDQRDCRAGAAEKPDKKYPPSISGRRA